MLPDFIFPQQSNETVQPRCPVFSRCGGCAFQHISYRQELDIKEQSLRRYFLEELAIGADVFKPIMPSPKDYQYRNRLDLAGRRTRVKGMLVGLTGKGSRDVLEIEECPIAMEPISDFIPRLRKQVVATIPDKYRTASLVVRMSGDGRVVWGGVGRKSLKQTPDEYLYAEINGKRIYYSMESFFQANVSILPGVVDLLRGLDIWDPQATLFDLYGGVGLFGAMLADLVGEVILLEDVKAATDAAAYNVRQLKLENFKIVQGPAEELLPGLLNDTAGRKRIAFVDPPRGGLKLGALEALTGATELSSVLYLSCNPVTLVDNLKNFLHKGWRVRHIWPMDFFPKTKHLETMVLLVPEA